MIHLTVNSSDAITSNEFDLMLLDKANVIYKPILQFVSQETDAGIFGLATILALDTKQRFFRLRITLSNDGSKDIATGKFGFGTYELPFGLYNYNVYDNTSDTNTSITDLKIIHKGMMNVNSDQSATKFVDKKHKQNNNVFVSNNLA